MNFISAAVIDLFLALIVHHTEPGTTGDKEVLTYEKFKHAPS